jgi:hypothetical protein
MLVSFNLEKLWIFNFQLFQVVKDMHLWETFTIRKRKKIRFDSLEMLLWLSGNLVFDCAFLISFYNCY